MAMDGTLGTDLQAPVKDRGGAGAAAALEERIGYAKTTLQEWAQGRGLAAPSYAIVGRSGPDHAPRFEVEVNVTGLAPHRGAGRTRREAEQDAAAAALVGQGVWNADGTAA